MPSHQIFFSNNAAEFIKLSEYIFMIDYGSVTPPHDHGAVAVIDGQNIKITPFRAANVPPPMALHEISVHSNAIDVTFNVDASMIAILHQEGISIFEWKSISASGSPPILTGRYIFGEIELAQALQQQICFTDANDVLTLGQQELASCVTRYGCNDDTGRIDRKADEDIPSSTLTTLSSFNDNGSVHAFTQDVSGGLHSLSSGGLSLTQFVSPTVLPWIKILSYDDSRIVFGMSINGNLYANSRLLVKNCTSFLVTPAHLIFTTTTHLVKFIHIEGITGVDGMITSLTRHAKH